MQQALLDCPAAVCFMLKGGKSGDESFCRRRSARFLVRKRTIDLGGYGAFRVPSGRKRHSGRRAQSDGSPRGVRTLRTVGPMDDTLYRSRRQNGNPRQGSDRQEKEKSIGLTVPIRVLGAKDVLLFFVLRSVVIIEIERAVRLRIRVGCARAVPMPLRVGVRAGDRRSVLPAMRKVEAKRGSVMVMGHDAAQQHHRCRQGGKKQCDTCSEAFAVHR